MCLIDNKTIYDGCNHEVITNTTTQFCIFTPHCRELDHHVSGINKTATGLCSVCEGQKQADLNHEEKELAQQKHLVHRKRAEPTAADNLEVTSIEAGSNIRLGNGISTSVTDKENKETSTRKGSKTPPRLNPKISRDLPATPVGKKVRETTPTSPFNSKDSPKKSKSQSSNSQSPDVDDGPLTIAQKRWFFDPIAITNLNNILMHREPVPWADTKALLYCILDVPPYLSRSELVETWAWYAAVRLNQTELDEALAIVARKGLSRAFCDEIIRAQMCWDRGGWDMPRPRARHNKPMDGLGDGHDV